MTKGSIAFRGAPTHELTPRKLLELGVVQVMEGRRCFGHLTVEENLLVGAFARRPSRADTKRDLEKMYTYFPALKKRRHAVSGSWTGQARVNARAGTARYRALPPGSRA